MKLKLYLIPMLILVIIFGGIALSNLFGWWQTHVQKTPVKFERGEHQGEYDPYDIRGSYSFEDIERSFDVSVELLAEAFPISDKDFETVKAQDVEGYYGEMNFPYEIGTGSVKYFVALYCDLPFDGEEALPDTAIYVLERDGKIELGSMVGLNTVDAYTKTEFGIEETEASEYITLSEGKFAITGDTTIKEALEHGIMLEDLEKIIGKIDNENYLIKDVVEANGFSFGKVKDSLNDLIN
jgi:hypothetical protein